MQVVFFREEKQMTLEFNKDFSSITLREAREKLSEQGFFVEKGKDRGSDYRFVYPEVEILDDEEYAAYADRVVGRSSEKDICLNRMFLKSGAQVVFANVNTNENERPDLIGFRTTHWGNEVMQVMCRLRPGGDYNASSIPEPFMLTDVISTREKDFYKIHIPNALVCVQNSVIEFPIACRCTVGMAYSAWMGGQRIFDYATPLAPYQSDEVAYGCVDCFNNGKYSNEQEGPKAIKVEKLSAEEISSKDLVSYDITFTAMDVTQWSEQKNGKVTGTYTKDTKKPVFMSINSIKESSGGMSAQQVHLSGKSYFEGKVIPGQKVPKRLPGMHTFSVDKTGDIIDTLRVKILVFKDWETANKFVGRYNN